MATEDIPYGVSDYAMTKEEVAPDVDRPNKSVLLKVQKYLEQQIERSLSIDALSLPHNATDEEKVAAFNEIAIHKGVAMHLRNIKSTIDNKVKELK